MSELTLDQVDLLDHDLFAEREPWDVFELLRREAPVYWHEGPEEGDGFWNVTRYDDLVYVLKNAKLFSSEANGAAQVEWMEPDVLEARRNFMETDPPRHTAWRRQFARSFTPRAVAEYSDFLRALTAQMLDEAMRARRGRVRARHRARDPDPRPRPHARRARGAPRRAWSSSATG